MSTLTGFVETALRAPRREPSRAPLPSFSPEQMRAAIERICASELPEELVYWAGQYETVGHRNTFLWKWVLEGIRLTALPCMDPRLRDSANVTKVMGVMLDVLLDDVADRSGEARYLERLLRIPFADAPLGFEEFSAPQRAYAEVAQRLWQAIASRVRSCPRYAQFEDVLRFDYAQLLNAMRYSHLINGRVGLLNLIEHDLYLPHNMHMMVSGTIDLMCSPDFDTDELGTLREALWHAQCMGRIGNLVTTWERELPDHDFSSGVYARALQLNVLQVRDLREPQPEAVRQAVASADCEAYFLRRWHRHREQILLRAPRVRSVDLRALVAGLQRLIVIHLGSRGLK
jgi:hypothetical protein